jgi:hypothetical protein
MSNEEIKILLEKYFDGETTTEEENALSSYFNGDRIANDLKQYQPLFQFFKKEKEVTLSQSATYKILNIPKSKPEMKVIRGSSKWWKAAAAIFILGVGSFFLIEKMYKPATKTLVENSRITIYDENGDPEKAFAEVQAALKKVSKKMKKGNDEAMQGLQKVQKASRELDRIVPK